MDEQKINAALTDGDLSAWILALEWDEIHTLAPGRCGNCGAPVMSDPILARKGATVAAYMPAPVGHGETIASLQGFPSALDAHEAIEEMRLEYVEAVATAEAGGTDVEALITRILSEG
jgi:hypothetical protein